jgi:hypothetical protein
VSGKLKETLFVATSRRAPLNAKLPLAAWARFLFSRPQRSGEETRHKKELRKHLSFRKRAGPNFFRLSGNRVLKTAFVLRDGPLDPPAPHPSEVRPFEPWCQQHRGSLHLRLRLRCFGIPHSLVGRRWWLWPQFGNKPQNLLEHLVHYCSAICFKWSPLSSASTNSARRPQTDAH